MNWTRDCKICFGLDLTRPHSSEGNSIIENCEIKNVINLNVDHKRFCLKILRPIYENLKALHFTTDFVSNFLSSIFECLESRKTFIFNRSDAFPTKVSTGIFFIAKKPS